MKKDMMIRRHDKPVLVVKIFDMQYRNMIVRPTRRIGMIKKNFKPYYFLCVFNEYSSQQGSLMNKSQISHNLKVVTNITFVDR